MVDFSSRCPEFTFIGVFGASSAKKIPYPAENRIGKMIVVGSLFASITAKTPMFVLALVYSSGIKRV